MSRPIRILFFAWAAFFCFAASYLFVQTLPFYKTFGGEEDLFYGKVSSVALVRGWSGTRIPLLDKTLIYLNGDHNAAFVLSLPRSQEDVLMEWFSFWAETAPAAIEVRGIRISDSEWVVTGIGGNNGVLDSDEIRNFHLRAMFWFSVLDLGLLALSFLMLRRAVRRRR